MQMPPIFSPRSAGANRRCLMSALPSISRNFVPISDCMVTQPASDIEPREISSSARHNEIRKSRAEAAALGRIAQAEETERGDFGEQFARERMRLVDLGGARRDALVAKARERVADLDLLVAEARNSFVGAFAVKAHKYRAPPAARSRRCGLPPPLSCDHAVFGSPSAAAAARDLVVERALRHAEDQILCCAAPRGVSRRGN